MKFLHIFRRGDEAVSVRNKLADSFRVREGHVQSELVFQVLQKVIDAEIFTSESEAAINLVFFHVDVVQ